MPVYLDIYNLIIPKTVVCEKYPGGTDGFLDDFNFESFEINQEDDEVFCFGQTDLDSLPTEDLINKGFHFDTVKQCSKDFVVIYRYGDHYWSVPWLQHNGVFAWHMDAARESIKKVEEICDLTMDQISEMIDKGQSPLKPVRINAGK